MLRQRKVTTWARVQVASGAKVEALMPLVIPCATAQATAGAYQAPGFTSEKAAVPADAGQPAARHRKVTIWPRVQVASGAKAAALTPLVIPCSTAQATARE